MVSYQNTYNIWVNNASEDPDIVQELKDIENNDEKIEDAFYRDLEFGTGGLRGIIGAGTNRMNLYTVAKASQGLSNYIIKNFIKSDYKVAIAYDSRIKSDLFSKISAEVFAANGIHVYIYKELMPTPCLSFAVRKLKCASGIVITASHNSSKYNGYKVYGQDGCQITTEVASEILEEIEKVDVFNDVKRKPFNEEILLHNISYIDDSVLKEYIENVKSQTVIGEKEIIDRNAAIVYSPLNGTGLKPVLKVLSESGFSNISVVSEQEKPDGLFPTCPYPNPEIKEAMTLGIRYAKSKNADLLLATDPDCDRCGIAVKNQSGEFQLLSANEVGLLLLDYICCQRTIKGTMPAHPVFVKTIVTTDLSEKIAQSYGVQTVNVLTGFKFIGEQIGRLEKDGHASDFICGFEESYGYLTGSYVRDKDAVNASLMISEMFAYYKAHGITLLEKLNAIYKKFGYCLNTLHSYEFEGLAGIKKMQGIMQQLRSSVNSIGGKKIKSTLDYSLGIFDLPKSNVLKFLLEDECSVVVRPSGTEPKLKIYFSIIEKDEALARQLESKMLTNLIQFIERA